MPHERLWEVLMRVSLPPKLSHQPFPGPGLCYQPLWIKISFPWAAFYGKTGRYSILFLEDGSTA